MRARTRPAMSDLLATAWRANSTEAAGQGLLLDAYSRSRRPRGPFSLRPVARLNRAQPARAGQVRFRTARIRQSRPAVCRRPVQLRDPFQTPLVEAFLHPVAREDTVGEGRDLLVVGSLKHSECLRLAVAGGQSNALIAEKPGVAF